MAVLGESTITATGGPPAGNRVMVAQRAADTDGVSMGTSAPALTATPNWSSLPPGATAVNSSSEHTGIQKKGWILGQSSGAVAAIDSVGAGTWTVSVVITPASLGAAAFLVGMRAYQVSSDLATATLITLTTPTGGSAGANGWEYSASQTASVGAALTFTLTMASVGAVTLVTASKYLYVEFILKFSTDDTVAQTYALTSFTLTVPALGYTRTPADTLGAGTDAITRAFAGVRVPTVANVVPADSLTRTYGATRAPAETTTVTAQAVTRAFVGVRPVTDATTVTADTPARIFAGTRSPALSTPAGTDAVTRTYGAVRAPTDSTPAGTDAVTRLFSANRAPSDTTPAGAVAVTRQVGFGRLPVDTTPATADTPSRIFSANRFPREYLTGGTPDWPLNAPTKTLAGVTRDSAGAVLGSCTVKLFRQSDDLMVATVTSDAVTGAYSFVRGGDDIFVYYVLAYAPGSPQKHGVTDRSLVPA